MLKGKIMAGDFFLGLAGYTHARNEVSTDPKIDIELKMRNNLEEAQRLSELVLDKIE